MKKTAVSESVSGLPDDGQIREMILRLSDPYHVMAWIMVETGARISDLTGMTVHAFSAAKKQLVIEEGPDERRFILSDGLVAALADYVARLRPVYEQQGRRFFRLVRAPRVERPGRFSESLLFPAWSVAGYEETAGNLAIPSAWFVTALEVAARAGGFTGGVHSHTLRHACARRWFSQGLDVAEVNRRLGHRDVMTTVLMAQALHHGGLRFTTAA